MLYVIESDDQGRVVRAHPCHNGIDQALPWIATALSDPEEDVYAVEDAVRETWAQAVRDGEPSSDGIEPGGAQRLFSMSRRGFPYRYGLVSSVGDEVEAVLR